MTNLSDLEIKDGDRIVFTCTTTFTDPGPLTFQHAVFYQERPLRWHERVAMFFGRPDPRLVGWWTSDEKEG